MLSQNAQFVKPESRENWPIGRLAFLRAKWHGPGEGGHLARRLHGLEARAPLCGMGILPMSSRAGSPCHLWPFPPGLCVLVCSRETYALKRALQTAGAQPSSECCSHAIAFPRRRGWKPAPQFAKFAGLRQELMPFEAPVCCGPCPKAPRV